MHHNIAPVARTATPTNERMKVATFCDTPHPNNNFSSNWEIKVIGSLMKFIQVPPGDIKKAESKIPLQPRLIPSYDLDPFQCAFTPGIDQSCCQDGDK